MRAFEIKEGTEVLVHDNESGWDPHYLTEKHTTKRDLIFFEEDVEIDPLGKMGIGPFGVTVGAMYAENGCYGFKYKNFTIITHHCNIKIH
jgi:hypothetical protein